MTKKIFRTEKLNKIMKLITIIVSFRLLHCSQLYITNIKEMLTFCSIYTIIYMMDQEKYFHKDSFLQNFDKYNRDNIITYIVDNNVCT